MKKNLFSALAVAFMLVIALASGGDKSAKKDSDSDSEQTTAESGPKTKWEYSEETDKMEGTTNYYAGLKSTNKVDLKFPYKGGSTLSIFVRNLGKGNDVYLFLDKGQIMPSLIGEKTVKFKFDDEATINYKYTTATGSSNNYVFLDKEKELLNKLLKAKKVMVEIEIFDAGLNVFEYDAQGLVWDKK